MSLNIETRHGSHPEDAKKYDTKDLRKKFLIELLFVPGEIRAVYTMHDRLIVGGIQVGDSSLRLETADQLKSAYFLERREMGIINVGSACRISVDGEEIELAHKEALYIGRGVKDVLFHPVKVGESYLYFNSAPAHKAYPTQKIGLNQAEIVHLGSEENANKRTIYKLLVAPHIQTCQLQMGLTELHSGSIWNTMPAHTHDRRMEAYFYFNINEGQTVCHFMGEPNETRHIWMQNHQAVISPPWSIHSGAGTSNYSFIWGMAGENLDYGDMDMVSPNQLR